MVEPLFISSDLKKKLREKHYLDASEVEFL